MDTSTMIAGLTDEKGLIIRPRLRDAYDRIVGAHGENTWDGIRAAEALLRTIEKVAAHRGEHPDTTARLMGL